MSQPRLPFISDPNPEVQELGRMVAALALGADGTNMGTRFCATHEAPIHDNVKKLLIANDERSTNLIFRKLRNTARVGKNTISDEVVAILDRPESTFDDVAALVRGTRGREVLETGDLSAGIYWAGQVQGLIHDIPSVSELILRIIREATELIQRRLAALLA